MVTMLSGGAEGADTEWGEIASLHGHEVLHFSFEGHNIKCKNGQIVSLPYNHLIIADPWLKKAKQYLGRNFPSKSKYVNNLLRRNFYQIKETDAVYAIGTFDRNMVLNGGTSWAIQMSIIINPDCPRYIFDQDKKKWFLYKSNLDFKQIFKPPTPNSGVWTGIGTRDINLDGKLAIDSIFN